LNHGNLVWHYLQKLISGNWEGMKIPEWYEKNHAYIVSKIHSLEILKKYSINHDCGKHLCKTIDEQGKIHYPKHEEYSCNYWLEHFPEETVVSWLILNDMFFHTCSSSELDNHNFSEKDLFSLLITSLAEIHANSELFGGIESTSFKVKYKQIDRRGNKVCKTYIAEHDSYIYVIIRNDLEFPQKAVQAGHSLLEISKKYSLKSHPSLVYLVVKSEQKLKMIAQELIDNDVNFSLFREPDRNNEITSIATEPIKEDKRHLFKRFMLL
jgi:hypothetical protein